MALGGEQTAPECYSACFHAVRKMPGDGLIVLENMAVTINDFQVFLHGTPLSIDDLC
jgi:hypothetical protein